MVSDLEENDFVRLPALYTRPEIQVCNEDIPTQEDVDQWPHLGGVSILHVDAEIGLLIVSDVPEALDPVEIKYSENGGPYASGTRIGWAVNGPLGHGSQAVSSFFKVDPSFSTWQRNFTIVILPTPLLMIRQRCRKMNAALCRTLRRYS